MPESREDEASFAIFKDAFEELQDTTLFELRGIHIDASNQEQGQYNAEDGHVFRIGPDCQIARGTSGSQTHVFPSDFALTPDNANPPPLTTLTLQGAHPGNHTIILDFGTHFLKVAYLTHTSLQFYTRKVWTDSILAVNKHDRGFHVGLALEFEDYFLTFLTNDLVFQPVWGRSLEELRKGYVNVYQDFGKFLKIVAQWIIERATSTTRNGLVCEVIRDASHIWFGVGVYTICEILFMAGVSPFLKEIEVFDNPSRTGRICEAFWSYKHKSATDLRSLLKPCMIDGILAPTQEQCLSYRNWLHVYGKATSAITHRMATLIDCYTAILADQSNTWYCYPTMTDVPALYDVFEPNYLQPAFELKDVHLGELIFGYDEWAQYRMKPGKSNALTDMFAYKGLLDEPTFLSSTTYGDLFAPYGPTIWQHRQTFTYRLSKQVWSMTPCFPENSRMNPKDKGSRKTITEITGQKRHAMLFSTIVSNTRGVAIGPLEYCGNAKVVKMPHGKNIVSVVHHDPSLPAFYAEREMIGLEHKSNGLDRKNTNKKSMSGAQQLKRRKIVTQTRSLSCPSPDASSSSTLPLPPLILTTLTTSNSLNVRPAKKRHLSADKALVVSTVGVENIDIDSISIGRRNL